MDTYRTYSIDEAKTRMESYCAYRERCHKEVAMKLGEMRMIPEAVDHIIHHLITHNYLNETRFAQAFARGKFRIKKWGKNRIVRELKARDMSQYNINLAIKEISQIEYLETFHELAEKRWEQLNSEENLQKKKKKFADYLLYRGWESILIWERLNELISSEKK
jgi:regulatory protein